MKFKKQKRKEVFLGSFRCEIDENTEDLLKPLLPVSRRMVEGLFFYTFQDGHIEVRTVKEVLDEMVHEIRGDQNGKES